jgi:hypothetical protein
MDDVTNRILDSASFIPSKDGAGMEFDGEMADSRLKAEVQTAACEAVLPVPFDRSYWVVPGKFLAGAYPGDHVPEYAAEKLNPFLRTGIRCFIDLTCLGESNLFGQPLVSYQDTLAKISKKMNIIYRNMPVVDMEVPSPAEMQAILDCIDGAILSSLPVYTHCLGGLGRTGTVVGCWLIRHGIEDRYGVIELIRRLRRNEMHAGIPSPQTAEQRRFILEWKAGE